MMNKEEEEEVEDDDDERSTTSTPLEPPRRPKREPSTPIHSSQRGYTAMMRGGGSPPAPCDSLSDHQPTSERRVESIECGAVRTCSCVRACNASSSYTYLHHPETPQSTSTPPRTPFPPPTRYWYQGMSHQAPSTTTHARHPPPPRPPVQTALSTKSPATHAPGRTALLLPRGLSNDG